MNYITGKCLFGQSVNRSFCIKQKLKQSCILKVKKITNVIFNIILAIL